jgi:hypothetical protein
MSSIKILLLILSIGFNSWAITCSKENTPKNKLNELLFNGISLGHQLTIEESENIVQIQLSKSLSSDHQEFRCFQENETSRLQCHYEIISFDNSKNSKEIILSVLPEDTPQEVQTEIEQVTGEIQEDEESNEARLTIIIATDNDNRMYGGLARILDQVHHDDFGYTHGAFLDGSVTIPDLADLSLGLSFTSRLFTTRTPGQIREQFFTDENRYELTVGRDHLFGSSFFLSLGLLTLNSNDSNSFIYGSAQQRALHDLTNYRPYTYIEDGQGLRIGTLTSLEYVYRSEMLRLAGNRVIMNHQERVDATLSSLLAASNITLSATGQFIVQNPSGLVGIGLDGTLEGDLHSDGAQVISVIGGEIFAGPVSLRYEEVQQLAGDLHNYADYNLPSLKPELDDEHESFGRIFLMVDFNFWRRRQTN